MLNLRDESDLPGFFDRNGLRQMSRSERRILSRTVRSGTVGQAALSKATGLAQQSVSRIVKELVSIGALAEARRWDPRTRNGVATMVRIATARRRW